MTDGVLQTNKLSAETGALRLLGHGGINLLDLSLDLSLDAQVLPAGAAAAGLTELAGATIPLTLRGPISGPKVGMDLGGLVSNQLRNAVEQRARSELMERLEKGGKPAAGASSGEGAGTDPFSRRPTPRNHRQKTC